MKIPKDHHRFILGPKGKRLAELELLTATKISIPRQDENSDVITITGTKDGIERARHEIQEISDEQVWSHVLYVQILISMSLFLLGCFCTPYICIVKYRYWFLFL